MAPKAKAPAKPAPGKPAPGKPDPAKPDPAKPDPAKPDPAKPDPAKPDAKAPKPGEDKDQYADFPFNIATRRTMWCILGFIALIGIIFLAIVVHFYLMWKTTEKLPIEDPMRNLRRTMATGLRNRNVNYENYTLYTKVTKTANGWDILGNNIYYVSESKKSWFDAENFCQSRDSHLASILTNEEQNFIAAHIADSFWIGLTDENVEGNWEWSDGSEVMTEYWARCKKNFSRGHEAAEKDCVFIDYSPGNLLYSWKDANCHNLKRWVCKEAITVLNDKFNQVF
ncbi:C-type lectin domain family 4 member A-like isoform X2 [Anolis carolinensis]|uniref:C-type lectin domain family 4 member A-like isoform X2 n=1 Tax=Anolis carolinensis TaxID=28377 RepID=UPI002F2B5AE4